jgi:hypothetical protein
LFFTIIKKEQKIREITFTFKGEDIMLNFTGQTAHFEDWYEAIKEYTPRSTYFRVDDDTKKVIIAKTFDKLCQTIPYFGEMHHRMDTTGLNEVSLITSLVEQMNLHVKREDVFFRTNLFSPKDVKSPCLVSSGQEALELLLSSSRLYRGYRELLKEQDLVLVFREKVDYQEEFRCFIENGQVKGISQYDDSDSIRKGTGASRIFSFTTKDYLPIMDYVEHVVASTGIQSCVLDIGITPVGMSVIELNPFGEVTDKSLFAQSDIYGEPLSGNTDIRFWKDHQTIRILEVKNRKIVQEYDEWMMKKPSEENHRLDALRIALQGFQLN